jgi:glutamate racemase
MRLVRLVEIGNTAGEEAQAIVSEDLSVFRDKGIDTLVLGCTHFPLLSELISRAMGPDVALVNPAEETALEAAEVLAVKLDEERGKVGEKGSGDAPRHRFYTSGDPETFKRLGSLFLGRDIENAERVVF